MTRRNGAILVSFLVLAVVAVAQPQLTLPPLEETENSVMDSSGSRSTTVAELPLLSVSSTVLSTSPSGTTKVQGVVDRKFIALNSAAVISAILDAHSTTRCLHARTCREANPLYGSNPSAARVWAQTGAITGGLVLFDYWLKKSARRSGGSYKYAWVVFPAATVTLHLVAARHNYNIAAR